MYIPGMRDSGLGCRSIRELICPSCRTGSATTRLRHARGTGNFAVAGHRTTPRRPFGNRPTGQGDQVIVETKHGWYIYEPDPLRDHRRLQGWVLDPVPGKPRNYGADQALITIHACHPKFSAAAAVRLVRSPGGRVLAVIRHAARHRGVRQGRQAGRSERLLQRRPRPPMPHRRSPAPSNPRLRRTCLARQRRVPGPGAGRRDYALLSATRRRKDDCTRGCGITLPGSVPVRSSSPMLAILVVIVARFWWILRWWPNGCRWIISISNSRPPAHQPGLFMTRFLSWTTADSSSSTWRRYPQATRGGRHRPAQRRRAARDGAGDTTAYPGRPRTGTPAGSGVCQPWIVRGVRVPSCRSSASAWATSHRRGVRRRRGPGA